MKATAYFGMIVLAVSSGLAQAQSTTPVTTDVAVGVGAGPYYGGYPYGYYSSTPGEGYARGLAAVIRSHGDYNLSTGAAAINFSQARQQEIENQKDWTRTYFEIRDINRQAFESEQKRRRGSPEDWIRFAQAGKPKRLSPSELDAVTGEIHWPILLTSQAFSPQRVELEKAFADRAYHGIMEAEVFLRVLRVTDDLLSGLRAQIRNLPPEKFVVAKRFLESLAYEAGQPSG